MARHGRKSFKQAINQLNVIAATALGGFFFVGMVMVGLAGDIVAWFEANRYLPLAASYMLMAVTFLSSGSRDTSQYHWFEKTFVLLIMFVMLLFAWQPFVDLVARFDPFGAIFVLGLMSIATAILAR